MKNWIVKNLARLKPTGDENTIPESPSGAHDHRHLTLSDTEAQKPGEDAAFAGAVITTNCQNCGTVLAGPYCSNCGQPDREFRRPFWSLALEMMEEALELDGRLARTIGPLMFLPGVLTRDYINGRRARFVPPIRLYIITSIIFFVLISITDYAIVKIEAFPKDADVVAAEQDALDEQLGEFESFQQGMSVRTVVDSIGKTEGRTRDISLRTFIRALQSQPQADQTRSLRILASNIQLSDRDLDVIRQESPSMAVLAAALGSGGTVNAATEDDPDNVVVIGNGPSSNVDVEVHMFVPAEPSPGAVSLPERDLTKALQSIRDQQLNPETSQSELTFLLFAERVTLGLQRVVQDPRAMNRALNDWIPRAMIFLLPIFAVLLRMFYWSRAQYLFKMFVFSLHFHTYIFAVMIFFVLAEISLGALVSSWMFIAAIPLYLFIGMKVVSGQGYLRTTFKFITFGFIYSLLMSLTLLAAMLFGLSEV